MFGYTSFMKTLLFFTLFFAQALYGIVSISPVEIGADAGFHTKVGLSLETVRGNTHKDNYKGSAKFIYDNNATYVTFLEFSGQYGKTNHIEDTNNAYAHFRYVYALTPEFIRVEFFLQTQEDKFKEIEYRRLAGVGFRFKFLTFLENGEGYFGIGGFYESINYLENNDIKNFVLNNYITYNYMFSEGKNLAYRLDFQPTSSDFSDYILIQKLELTIQLYEKLSLVVQMTHDVDSAPVDGVAKDNFSQTTGLIYEF